MNLFDKKRTEKLIDLIFNRVETDKKIKLEFDHEKINNVDEEVLYANIELDEKECKIFNKIKDLKYFIHLIKQNFIFTDPDGRIYTTRKIEYICPNNDNDKFKIKITLLKFNPKPKDNCITQVPTMKSDDNHEKEAQASEMKTTTQKYLNMNHRLIQLRDAIFDPNVIDEKDEDDETVKRVINALDVLCYYLDDYKESNNIKTRIKE